MHCESATFIDSPKLYSIFSSSISAMKPRTQRLLLSFFALILMLHISQSSQLSDPQSHLIRPRNQPRRLLPSVATFSSNQNKPNKAIEDPHKPIETSLKKAPPSKSNPTHNRTRESATGAITADIVASCTSSQQDAPDEQSDNTGTLRRRKKIRVAEFAQRIMASLSRNQDETPALTQRKVCNFFIKKSCRMGRPKCTSNRMTQVEGQAVGPHPSGKVITQGMQNKEKLSSFKFEGEPAQRKSKVCNSINNKEMPSSSKFDVEDNEERKKRRRKSY